MLGAGTSSRHRYRLLLGVLSYGFIKASFAAERDAVDDLQKGQCAGFDDVSADTAGAVGFAVTLGFDLGLALRILSNGDAANAVITQLHLDAGDAFDALEDGVDRAVAGAGVAAQFAVAAPQAHSCRRDRARAGVAGEGVQRPEHRAVVYLGLAQGLDISVANRLRAVGQPFEGIEYVLHLFVVQVVAQLDDAVAQRVPAAVLAQNQLGLGQADVFGVHDFISRALLEHAILMNARF